MWAGVAAGLHYLLVKVGGDCHRHGLELLEPPVLA